MTNEALLDELVEWLSIPSISSGGGDPRELIRAAEWAQRKITAAGGTAEVQQTQGNPLVVGELASSRPNAPDVLIYGHYDVQSPDPLDAWTTPPFEPAIRDERLYARGAADDKGNFFPLLFVACELAAAGELPVNVRVLIDGEEEVGGDSAAQWVESDPRGAACAIVFDSEMLDETTPAITLGARGMVAVRIDVRTAPRDLHSGMYGGSVLNAVHVVHRMLAAVLPGPDGRLRDELRAGIQDPTAEELVEWKSLPPGDDVISEVGGRPLTEQSGAEYYMRNWGDASLDVTGLAGGDAVQMRTITPAFAQAKLAMRLAPGQDSAEMARVLERLLKDAAPANADVTISFDHADAAVFDPRDRALVIAREALEAACGAPPALIRTGGSLPVLAAFARRDIPTILSGFTLAQDAFHAPDESFRVESVRLGEAAARELYARLAALAP
ncbi:MAG: M20/M25/M40 family metallo-hydrolase [Actinomycetota bacterium]|nr:M20/M25/M40 family metallo-hydrolase [Actinomycetota bacterium]